MGRAGRFEGAGSMGYKLATTFGVVIYQEPMSQKREGCPRLTGSSTPDPEARQRPSARVHPFLAPLGVRNDAGVHLLEGFRGSLERQRSIHSLRLGGGKQR